MFVIQTYALLEEDDAFAAALIDKGLRYSDLNPVDSLHADQLISLLIRGSGDVLPIIAARSETSWFLSPYVIHLVLPRASAQGRRFFHMFKYGRAYGQREPRKRCLGEGGAWGCWNRVHVIMSPDEVKELRQEIESLLKKLPQTDLWKDHAVRDEIVDLGQALARTASASRAMYFVVTD